MIYQFFLIFALFDDIISYNHGNICLLSVIFLLLLFGALYQIMASGKNDLLRSYVKVQKSGPKPRMNILMNAMLGQPYPFFFRAEMVLD